MSQNLRKLVLKSFKSLHKTSKNVFNGDEFALEKARQRINEEFRLCKNLDDEEKIKEKIVICQQVEDELRKNVIQAEEIAPGQYKLIIRKDTVKLDNVPFKGCDQ